MEIGHRIARARTAAGLTQTELADEIGVSRGLVGQWESHKKVPGRDNLAKVAKRTLVSMLWLMTGETDDDEGVKVTDPEAIKMLRIFMRMSGRQRKNTIELFDVSADIAGEMKQNRRPSKSKQPVG